ncbi:MAG: HD-GYP domain-containing protein [Planctomycetes bacterium]|nr:HD-GYP domain-containing protein [Planctomycetota bacterium]
MAVTQATLPTPAVTAPPGVAQDVLRKTGVAVVFFGPDGRPLAEGGAAAAVAAPPPGAVAAEDPASRLAREALARGEEQFEIGQGAIRSAWVLGPRSRGVAVAVGELAITGRESLDVGRRLLAAVGETVRARVRETATCLENEAASESLLQSFEEVSLLHHLGEVLRVNRSEEDLLERICRELRDTIDAEATAAYLPGQGGAGPRTIVVGRLPFAAADVARVVDHLLEGMGREPPLLINNHCQDDPLLAHLAPGLRRVVLVPLPVADGLRGALMAANRTGEEFGSPDAKLVRSTASAGTIFVENRRLFRELQEMMLDLVRALVSSVDAKDPYTCGHSERVAIISRRIAACLRLPDDDVELVYLAGLLHDIGKIGTPESILRKEGRLGPEERLTIMQHCEVGFNILSGIHKLESAREVVLLHHERLDGTGYPRGLKGDQIPLLARIVGLADSFDAMTSNRPYRPMLPLDQVRREIERHTGTQFDSRAVEALLGMNLEQVLVELESRPKVSLQ